MLTNIFQNRKAENPVDELFLNRWSPRSFDINFALSENQLMTVFEAARWSWSSSNVQPWRFIYGFRGDETYTKILNTLQEFNQVWAKHASVLVLVLAQTTNENESNYSALFDTGAACMSMSLQLQLLQLADRHMGGIDRDAARNVFEIPQEYTIHCAIAMGKQADSSELDDFNKARETPSTRLPVSELAKTRFDF